MVSRPEDEPEVKIINHQLFSYKIDPNYPEYVSKIWINDSYVISFYEEYATPLQFYNRNHETIYKLKITPDTDYVDPWFIEVDAIEKEVKEHGEEYVIEWILKTVKDYFSVIDDDDE